jgi:hypothetical protein
MIDYSFKCVIRSILYIGNDTINKRIGNLPNEIYFIEIEQTIHRQGRTIIIDPKQGHVCSILKTGVFKGQAAAYQSLKSENLKLVQV